MPQRIGLCDQLKDLIAESQQLAKDLPLKLNAVMGSVENSVT